MARKAVGKQLSKDFKEIQDKIIEGCVIFLKTKEYK